MLPRHEAEDIANGSPISGPDRLVERIQDALSAAYDYLSEETLNESWQAGYEVGYEAGKREAAKKGNLSVGDLIVETSKPKEDT